MPNTACGRKLVYQCSLMMICRASNTLIISYTSSRNQEKEACHWTGKGRESTRSGEVTFAAAQGQHPDIGLDLGQECRQVELRTNPTGCR